MNAIGGKWSKPVESKEANLSNREQPEVFVLEMSVNWLLIKALY